MFSTKYCPETSPAQNCSVDKRAALIIVGGAAGGLGRRAGRGRHRFDLKMKREAGGEVRAGRTVHSVGTANREFCRCKS